MGLSWMEITVIFGVLLLFFGAKRIPEVARALGKASREFKNARDGVVTEIRKSVEQTETPQTEKDSETPASPEKK